MPKKLFTGLMLTQNSFCKATNRWANSAIDFYGVVLVLGTLLKPRVNDRIKCKAQLHTALVQYLSNCWRYLTQYTVQWRYGGTGIYSLPV